MAITSGTGPHAAWLNCNGTWPIEHGRAALSAQRKTSSFSGAVPMSYSGARAAFAAMDAGATASISVMTRGQTSTLITGTLDEINFDYIKREIHFTGRDKSAALHENITSEKWLNQKVSSICTDLVGRCGIPVGKVVASGLLAGKQLHQDFVELSENQTYADIIHLAARLDGAKWWVDAKGMFNYVPYGSPEGTYSVTINQASDPISSDCIELKVTHNLQAGRPISVTAKGWHPRKRQLFSSTSNVSGKGPTRNYNYQVPTASQDHAQSHAKSEATEKARHELTVETTVVGDMSVSPGMGLSVSGTDFDGVYEIDHVHHDFGMSGHLTHITARTAGSGRSAS